MGRTEPSLGIAPASVRKDVRSKQARHTANKLIPSLLSAHPKARKGTEAVELIVDPPAVNARTDNGPTPTSGSKAKPAKARGKRRGSIVEADFDQRGDQSRTGSEDANGMHTQRKPLAITLRATDTITAAQSLQASLKNQKAAVATTAIGILNMASPLRPGGGFLQGATSQEEFLCMRTTLYPSLADNEDRFYRLPEVGGVWTPDVLVFRSGNADPEEGMLEKKDRFFVGVVTAGMIRFPDLLEESDDGEGRYASEKDRTLVVAKMRAVLRIAASKGVKKLILGAWGCGAYGNPVGEIARAWRVILTGDGGKRKGGVEDLGPLEEVVFSIKERKMAMDFASAWGEGLKLEEHDVEAIAEEDDDDDETDKHQELQQKVDEMEERIAQARNPAVKTSLEAVLANMRSQLGRTSISAHMAKADEEEDQTSYPESHGDEESEDEDSDGEED